jgi:hypothetical protein
MDMEKFEVGIRKNISVVASETYELPSNLSQEELQKELARLVKRDENEGRFLFEPDWDDQFGLKITRATDTKGSNRIDEVFVKPEDSELGYDARDLVSQLNKHEITIPEFAVLMLQSMRSSGNNVPNDTILSALLFEKNTRELEKLIELNSLIDSGCVIDAKTKDDLLNGGVRSEALTRVATDLEQAMNSDNAVAKVAKNPKPK